MKTPFIYMLPNKVFRTIGLFACLFLLFEPALVTPPQAATNADTYMMVPFLNMAKVYGSDAQVSSPYTFRAYKTGVVEVDGPTIVATEFQRQLSNLLQMPINGLAIGEKSVSEALKENSRLSANPRNLAIAAGKKAKVTYVIVGAVCIYQERVGRELTVDTPASISFEISLYRVADGTRLWSQSITETQQALSENLLNFGKFVKRKGVWLTAGELTRVNIQDILKTFPIPDSIRQNLDAVKMLPDTSSGD